MRTSIAIALVLGLSAISTGAAYAGEADCTAILDATIKVSTTPVHQKISIAMSAGRPALQSEVIHIKDKMYTQTTGHWVARPYDGEKIAADARQALAASEHSCSRDGSEPVNGQPADVYRMETATPKGKSNAKIWISPTSGLPLRQHTILIEGATAKGEHDVLFDYSNVATPAGAK